MKSPITITRLLTLFIVPVAATATTRALESSRYAPTSALSSGHWVKIAVDETGMHQLTDADLAAMGFDTPANVHVYGYGGAMLADHRLNADMPDDLPQQPSVYTGGKIIFYGESGSRLEWSTEPKGEDGRSVIKRQNQASIPGYYFLRQEDTPRLTPEAVDAGPARNVLNRHTALGYHDYMVDNPAQAGIYFIGDNKASTISSKTTFTYRRDRMVPSTYSYINFSGVGKGSRPRVKLTPYTSANAQNIQTITATANNEKESVTFAEMKRVIPHYFSSPVADGVYNIDIDWSESLETTLAATEHIAWIWTRHNYMDGTERTMHFRNLAAGDSIAVQDRAEGLQLWNVTDASRPYLLKNNISPDASGLQRIVAFYPTAALRAPRAIAETVANTDLHAMQTPVTVIVCPPSLQGAAREYADMLRQRLGITVQTAVTTDIYGEFSSGTPSVDGIRRFIKMLHDRGNGTLRNVLLMGAAHWDYRGVTGEHDARVDTYVPTFQVEDLMYQGDEAYSFGTDAFYGIMAESDTVQSLGALVSTPMTLNVGRIPAATPAAAANYLAKASHYLDNLGDPSTTGRVMLLSDYGDSNGHLRQSEALADTIAKYAPDVHITRHYMSLYVDRKTDLNQYKRVMKSNFNDGLQYVSYCGHGNYDMVGTFLKRNDVKQLDNKIMPIMHLSTCYTLPIDRENTGVGEEIVMSPNGGAIALVGAGRSVQMTYNQYLNLAMGRNVFNADAGHRTIGDIYRGAHNEACAPGLNYRIFNCLCYNLAGDPSLPAPRVTQSAKLTPDAELITLQPGTTNTIDGSVLTSDGDADTSFDGEVLLTLYGPDCTRNTLENSASDPVIAVSLQGERIASATAQVTGGRFTCSFPCPQVSEADTVIMRLNPVAVTSDGTRRAIGTHVHTNVATVADIEPSGLAPSITSLDIESEYIDGSIIYGDEAVVTATVADGNAPLSLSRGLTTETWLSVDGNRQQGVLRRFTSAGNGTHALVYPLTALADGQHTVTLSACDITGERSSATTTFTVINRPVESSLEVDRAIASDQVVISLQHGFKTDPSGRLTVTDNLGNHVLTIENPIFPLTWDLKDADGKRVADGRYTLRAWLKEKNSHSATPATHVFVIK